MLLNDDDETQRKTDRKFYAQCIIYFILNLQQHATNIPLASAEELKNSLVSMLNIERKPIVKSGVQTAQFPEPLKKADELKPGIPIAAKMKI